VQALQNTIDQSRIIAPFNGTVTEVSSVSGELVSGGTEDVSATEAVRIDNLDNLIVDIDVSEVDINSVEIGQPAILTFDALPNREYSGVVDSISSAGTDESGVVEFRVSVKVIDGDEDVKPGFTAVVSIITSEVEDALLIPTQAILMQEGIPVVMRVNDDGSTSAVPLELGATSDVYTQVIEGEISVGDQLAVTMTQSQDVGEFDPSMMRQMNQITNGGGRDGK
jgi:HlyD family secretion protein